MPQRARRSRRSSGFSSSWSVLAQEFEDVIQREAAPLQETDLPRALALAQGRLREAAAPDPLDARRAVRAGGAEGGGDRLVAATFRAQAVGALARPEAPRLRPERLLPEARIRGPCLR